MAPLRIALAQINPTVGDLAGNAALVRRDAAAAAAQGSDLVVFGEMALTGYPVEDLALRSSFQRASRAALAQLATDLAADGLGGMVVVVGFLDARPELDDGSPGRPRGGAQNAAAVIFGGEVVAVYAKHHLPNYGVFDEFRYFVPGAEPLVVRINDVDVAIAICEDMWQDGPVAQVRELGAGLLVVINGSPYERSKDDVRLALCQRRAAEAGCALAYVNLVGGQDELVFDGDSMVVDTDGRVLARAHEFVEELVVLDLELPPAAAEPRGIGTAAAEPRGIGTAAAEPRGIGTAAAEPRGIGTAAAEPRGIPRLATLPGHRPRLAPPVVAPELDDAPEVYLALTLGLADYVRKNGFRSVALGLSGGIDSALVAAIACDAIGAANVIGVSMPSKYSSAHSRDDAADLAERTGLSFRTAPIETMVAAFLDELGFTGLAEENLQARVRGVTLMGISNAEGPLVLATGNKSEIAVGYSTIYGDAVGGFAPIKDVPKSLVWELSRWRNEHAVARGETPPIPESSISKPPSAELRPDQLDTDSLPDYALLDDILDAYVEHDRGAEELLESGFDAELVERIVRMIDLAEYKRRQYPPGTKITFKAFGRDRRLPITNRWRERAGG